MAGKNADQSVLVAGIGLINRIFALTVLSDIVHKYTVFHCKKYEYS